MNLSIREMQESDAKLVVDYFINSTPDYLKNLGADLAKIPKRKDWIELLTKELLTENKQKKYYYIIWQLDGKDIGHSNISNITFGNDAFMHLHIWKPENRQKGIAIKFLKKTIPTYFENFKIEKLFCEPYAVNSAPTKTLLKLGFEFVKKHETIPGIISFHQKVKKFLLTKEKWVYS